VELHHLTEYLSSKLLVYFLTRPNFMAELRQREGVAGRALEFAILTAARTGEVLGARWPEIDLEGRLWTVPAGR
jgi:integrase